MKRNDSVLLNIDLKNCEIEHKRNSDLSFVV